MSSPEFVPSSEFETAAAEAKSLNPTVSQDELLKLYGLFKQTTVGDVNTERPGILDFQGKAKWDAWKALKDMTRKDAQSDYIAHVAGLKAKHGIRGV